MMKIPCWKSGMTPREGQDIAYMERNLLALCIADGWYYDTDNNWEGYKRVLTIGEGQMCFHIPDDFDVGNLPQVKPNWDGHTTEEKWRIVFKHFNIKEE